MAIPAKFLSVYIHWPFCEKKCPYCDFFSQATSADQNKIIEEYVSDLNFYHSLTPTREVKSIFFGGGTPSLIEPKNIEKLINHISSKWKISKNIEITLEANPNSLKAAALKSTGINRLSLGVQALNDKDLRFLGRIHDLKTALKSIDEVLTIFNNHSMDLIYARPDQSPKDWKEELRLASSFGFKHLSLYQLTIEEGTPFHKQGIKPLDEEKAYKLYQFTENFLNKKEYDKYEVSNFAIKGFESRHNLCYWEGGDYIGIGPAAHGRLSLGNKGLFATTHQRKLETLSKEERAEELLLMGLRLTKGIDKKNFKEQCGLELDSFINKDKLKELEYLKLISNSKDHIKATPEGFPLLNKLIEELIL